MIDDAKKLSEILVKHKIKGIIVSINEDGSIDYSKNCDPYGLMVIKSFVDFNTNEFIRETMQKPKMPVKKF